MRYYCSQMPLPAKLTAADQIMLGARLRAIAGIVSVSIDNQILKIWYKHNYAHASVKMAVQAICAKSNAEGESLDMADYRREAVLSVGSFVAVQLIRKFYPQAFASIKILRSLMIMYIARNFIKNGVNGLVRENRPNADTLTATAVIASVWLASQNPA